MKLANFKVPRIELVMVAAYAAAAALVLSIAAVAHAQQAQADTAPLTEAQTAGVRRVKEMIEVLNTGDYAKMRAYFEANSVDIRTDVPGVTPGSWHQTVFSQVLGRYHISRGYDLVRVTTEPSRGDVVGIVRNRLTGDDEYLAVIVEPQPPHRITWLPVMRPEVVATWNLQRAASVAETEQERLQEIGSYLKRMGDADVFSGAVVIARNGKPVFAQAYGHADREKKIPNTLDTPFLTGSMTKLFTGLAVGQLVEQGKLSYDDPLAKFLPDFPDPESAKKIQIKHLLSHTAGLGSAASLFNPDLVDRQTTVRGTVEALERKPPAFEPGTGWAYSNEGFVLLGRIIEIASGQDYYDYMQKNVFAPAGATSASFPLLPKNGVAVVPMAYPYEPAWDAANLRLFTESVLGKGTRRGSSAGGSVVSAFDLIKLSNAMHGGRIVKPETFRLQSSPKPELGAKSYGYGFFPTRYGRPYVGHAGNAQGQCTEFGELRDTPYTVVVLSNLARNRCGQVTERILRVLRAAPDAQSVSPAVKRLEELLAVVNSRDTGAMLAYIQANSVQTELPPGPALLSPGAPLAVRVLELHRYNSQGLDLVRVAKAEDRSAVAVVRNRRTGHEQVLSVEIEPQAPHRITKLPWTRRKDEANLVGAAAPTGQSEQARLQEIGSYLTRLAAADIFSGAVVIALDGKPVFAQAHGYADREKKIPNTLDTPFLLGSMNKLFTGLAIGQLVEQGKLSYDDALSKFLPDYPDAESAKKIKIKHLLSHTSGLDSFDPGFALPSDRTINVQAVLDIAGKQPIKFEPGTRWAYSNTGMQVLGRVIEIVSGQDYYDFVRNNVYLPGGMTRDPFPDYGRSAGAMARPYEIEWDGSRLNDVNKMAVTARRGGPAGGGIASARDLINLASAMYAGRIVKPETLRLHTSTKPELGSPMYGYGFGARFAGRPLVGHGGNAYGQCTQFGALTDTPYTIVVLSNLTILTCHMVTEEIFRLLPPSKAPGE